MVSAFTVEILSSKNLKQLLKESFRVPKVILCQTLYWRWKNLFYSFEIEKHKPIQSLLFYKSVISTCRRSLLKGIATYSHNKILVFLYLKNCKIPVQQQKRNDSFTSNFSGISVSSWCHTLYWKSQEPLNK